MVFDCTKHGTSWTIDSGYKVQNRQGDLWTHWSETIHCVGWTAHSVTNTKLWNFFQAIYFRVVWQQINCCHLFQAEKPALPVIVTCSVYGGSTYLYGRRRRMTGSHPGQGPSRKQAKRSHQRIQSRQRMFLLNLIGRCVLLVSLIYRSITDETLPNIVLSRSVQVLD